MASGVKTSLFAVGPRWEITAERSLEGILMWVEPVVESLMRRSDPGWVHGDAVNMHADWWVESAGSGSLLGGRVNHSLGSSSPLLMNKWVCFRLRSGSWSRSGNLIIWLVGSPTFCMGCTKFTTSGVPWCNYITEEWPLYWSATRWRRIC